jgi:hypothetical protein
MSEGRVDIAETTPGEWRVVLRSADGIRREVLDAGAARERADAAESAGDTEVAHQLRKAALELDEKTITI